MSQTKAPWWVSLIAFGLILWAVSSCVSDVMDVGAERRTAEPFQQTEVLALHRGTIGDWNGPTVTGYQRAMAARMIALEVYPNTQGRGLDDLERRMVACIDRASIRYPPSERLRMVALAECSVP